MGYQSSGYNRNKPIGSNQMLEMEQIEHGAHTDTNADTKKKESLLMLP